jgi:serine/threonine protein phosphatase 1
MRTFFVTDIHGHLQPLKNVLTHVSFDPSIDRLIIGGDMIDRGPDSAGVLQHIKALVTKYPLNVKAVLGNHEAMMRDYFKKQSDLWTFHGGYEVLEGLSETFGDQNEITEHVSWVSQLPLFVEDDKYVYTHAGIHPDRTLPFQNEEVIWMSETEFYDYEVDDILAATGGKKVLHGHTPCENILDDGARLGCDLGAGIFPSDIEALALVEVGTGFYYRYLINDGTISKRKIISGI